MQTLDKKALAKKLQAQIDAIQGLGKPLDVKQGSDFEPFDSAFPGRVFPLGAIHELVSYEPAHAASTTGFISAMAAKLTHRGGVCLWIAGDRKIFPPGLIHFGLQPDNIIFIQTAKPKDQLWIIEEALKCEGLAAVIGEIRQLGFSESRRLQLAVERSGVTGFVHRYRPMSENSLACTTRWKVTPLASSNPDGLPGVGTSCWDVQLLKVRNGKPRAWQINWTGEFSLLDNQNPIISLPERYAG